jgi:hypothetical protein
MKNPRVAALTLVVFLFTSLIPLQLASAVPTGTGLSLYYKSDSAAWSVPPTAFTAICSYRPSNHSYVTINATLDPTDSYYVGTVTSSAQYLVTRRTGAR